jgi:membrane protease YdiL (CAAX protease family)
MAITILCLLAIGSDRALAEQNTPPALAGLLSVVPGLGQTANGNPGEGLAWFAVILGGGALTAGNGYNQTIFLDLWMYNIYDAYRDAGPKRSYKQNVFANYASAFNPLNIWGPPSTVPLIAQTAGTLSKGRPSFGIGPNRPVLTPFYMAFIALGEEGLFRGFFFPGLSDLFNSTVAGAITSSLVFSAAHGLYAGQQSYAFRPGVFAWRTVLGLFYCWQTHIDKYDLSKSIFSHTWVNVLYEWDRQGVLGGGRLGESKKSRAPFSSIGLELSWRLP